MQSTVYVGPGINENTVDITFRALMPQGTKTKLGTTRSIHKLFYPEDGTREDSKTSVVISTVFSFTLVPT